MVSGADRGAVIRPKFETAQGHLACFFRLLYGKIMESKNAPSSKAQKAQAREDRLKAALKANMSRRKAQARARATTEDQTKGTDPSEQDKG